MKHWELLIFYNAPLNYEGNQSHLLLIRLATRAKATACTLMNWQFGNVLQAAVRRARERERESGCDGANCSAHCIIGSGC